MTTTLNSLLSEEGRLPDDLDWEMDIAVEEHQPENSDLVLKNIRWETALYYGGPSISEMLCDGGIYHQRLEGYFLVGITFQFHVKKDGTIMATGHLHTAEDHRGNYFTNEAETIMTADITISPKSARTAQALREYIANNHYSDEQKDKQQAE